MLIKAKLALDSRTGVGPRKRGSSQCQNIGFKCIASENYYLPLRAMCVCVCLIQYLSVDPNS